MSQEDIERLKRERAIAWRKYREANERLKLALKQAGE
jgi:hypothetical protein